MSIASKTCSSRLALRPLAVLLIQIGCLTSAFGVGPAGAEALPIGGVVKVGEAVITAPSPTSGGSVLEVNQKSNVAVIQWNSFNIGPDAQVIQRAPNASDLTINRVFDESLGASQALIQGKLTADHRIFLISPGGVMVTSGAVIDAPSVLLSSHDLKLGSERDPYAGFDAKSIALVNKGGNEVHIDYGAAIQAGSLATLRKSDTGTVMLVGPQVVDNGVIRVGGPSNIVLAASKYGQIDVGDSGFLTFAAVAPPASPTIPGGTSSPPVLDESPLPGLFVNGAIEAEGGATTPGALRLVSEGRIELGGAASIKATSGAVNVSMTSDVLGDRSGGVHLNGYGSLDFASERFAKASAVPLDGVSISKPLAFTSISISTGGGSFVIDGGVDGGAAGVNITSSTINTLSATGSAGDVTIRSHVSKLPEIRDSSIPVDGVNIQSSSIEARSVAVTGLTLGGTGVYQDQATLTGQQAGVDVRGVSQSGMGVGMGNSVVLNGGAGNVTVAGRGTDQGVSIGDLTITTSGALKQQITLAGQSTGTGRTGLGLSSDGGRPIQIHDQAGATLASGADLIIGATADSTGRALDLGTKSDGLAPQFQVSGRVNYRPLGVDTAGRITEAPSTVVKVGEAAPGATTNFVLLPEWFNPSVNATLPGVTVIGSSAQVGQISTAAGVLDSAGTVTLQNQGAGSQGILLGGNTGAGSTEVLSLLSAGDIGQTEASAIHADALNVIAPASSKVALNNPGNRVKRLSLDGVGDSSVSGESVPAASSSSGIPGYRASSEGADFETLAITRTAPPPEVETPTKPSVASDDLPKHFELPQAIDEQRSDVYVRDHFGRPQVCTATSVSATGLTVDAGVEPLALEWVKVRRSPQLSSCSGVRVDSACAAF